MDVFIGPDDENIVCGIKQRDIGTLREGVWLNDVVINKFMQALTKRDNGNCFFLVRTSCRGCCWNKHIRYMTTTWSVIGSDMFLIRTYFYWIRFSIQSTNKDLIGCCWSCISMTKQLSSVIPSQVAAIDT